MTTNNMELMKKIIEEKKKRSSQQMSKGRPAKCIGGSRKGIKSYKQGGVFDK